MDQNLYYGDVQRAEVLAVLIDEVLFDSDRFLCRVFMFYFVRWEHCLVVFFFWR